MYSCELPEDIKYPPGDVAQDTGYPLFLRQRAKTRVFTSHDPLAGHGGLSLVGGEQEKVDSMLVMSGGEGYIDFRLGKPTPASQSENAAFFVPSSQWSDSSEY